MANYIQSQSPWIGAANAFSQGAEPLMRLYSQLPQIQAQMQQHADQMGLQQQRIGLEQNDQAMRAPVYQAQTASYKANAQRDTEMALAQQILNSMAPRAEAAKRQSYLGMQGPAAQTPGVTNQADLLGLLAAASILGQGSGATALQNEQEPLKLNMGQTAFRPTVGGGVEPLAQGAMNPNIGSTLFQGISLPGTNAPTMQQGSFRPPGSTNLDPSTIAKNWAAVAQVADMLGMPQQAVGELLGRGTNAPTANPGMSAPVRVSTKAERDALPPGTQYVGPDGQIATKQ